MRSWRGKMALVVLLFAGRLGHGESIEKIEVQEHVPAVVAKETPILGIGNIAVHLQRIIVIRQIQAGQRQPNSMLRPEADISRNPSIGCEVARKTRLQIRIQGNVILQNICRLVGKAVTQLNTRRDSHAPGQDRCAPQEKSVGNFSCRTRRDA